MPELVVGGGWLGVYLPDNTLCGQLETLRAPLKGFQAANVSFSGPIILLSVGVKGTCVRTADATRR